MTLGVQVRSLITWHDSVCSTMLGGACLCYTMDFCPLLSDVEGDGANPKH
jgi:hypothetical protein